MKNHTVQTKLKPERVQTKLKPERVQIIVNGKAIDLDRVTFVVDGLELIPEHLTFGITITKLKPERVQIAFEQMAQGFRYASRGRLRKAVQSFSESIATFEQVAKDFAAFFGFTVDIDLIEDSTE